MNTFPQNADSLVIGKYTDGIGNNFITALTLRKNGTFYLKTVDPIFSYTHQTFENEGKWIFRNDSVILNPELTKLKTIINLTEKKSNFSDSILIKVNYFVDYFRSDTLLNRQEKQIELMTVCINKRRNYYNLVRKPFGKSCAFAPKVKNQVIIDSTNTFKTKRKDLIKIGVFTDGFDNMEWVQLSDNNSNNIEINVIQQIDVNRTPRNRELIIEGNKIYYYKRNGKLDKKQSNFHLSQ